MYRVLVVDDEHWVRRGLVHRIQRGIRASAGVSAPVTEPWKLLDAYGEAKRLLDSKLLSQSGALLVHAPVACASDGEIASGREPGSYPAVEEHRFLTALRSGDAESARAALSDFFKSLSPERTTVGWLRRAAETLVYSVERLLISRRTDMATLANVQPDALCERLRGMVDPESVSKELQRAWLPALAEYFGSPKELDGSAVVAEVVRTIEEEYYMPLSLQGLAERYGMHPDYLSRLFKKETGKNFIDYLTDVRIRKSRELIEKSRYKNYEIAAMVGYDDYRYFSQVFKKKCGMTINEYRALCFGKEKGSAARAGE